jgi:glycoside/pentoside/hexuronide:cation symporter, GPH family
VDNRAKTNSLSIIFTAFGTIATFLIGYLFLRNVPVLQMIVVILVIIGAAALLFTGITIREKKQFMEVPPLGTKDAILKSFVNKSFLTYEIFNFTYTLMYSIIQIALIQFAISVLELSNFEGTLILGLFSLVSVLGIPLMLYFNRHWGTKKTVVVFTALFTVAISFTLIIQSFIQILILVVILGLSYSAPSLLNPLLIANIIDEDELKTGRRREGMYFGGNALITKPALSVATFIVGLFNTYLFFNPGFNVHSVKYVQAASALLGIRLITGVIPALFLIIGLIFLLLFPLNKKRTEKMKIELDELHKKQVA